MTGRFGWPVRDPNAQTGPGSRNTIWLRVEFDRSAVLKGAAGRLPSLVNLPLMQSWNKDLRSEKESSLGRDFIFFLSSDMRPASAHFQHFDSARSEIQKAISREAETRKPDSK